MNAPILPPCLGIKIGGRSLDAATQMAVTGAWISLVVDRPGAAEVAFADIDANSLGALSLGDPIELEVGRRPIFTGDVTEVETSVGPLGEREVRVRARHSLHRLSCHQEPRSLVGKTVADLVREAADRIGAEAVIAADGPVRSRRVQTGASDLDVLVRVVQHAGLKLVAETGKLHLLPATGRESDVILRRGDNLFSVRLISSLDGLRRSCRVSGWDPRDAAHFESEDEAPARPLRVAEALSNLGERRLLGRMVESVDEARGLARADLDQAAARARRLSGTAEGHLGLTPGTVVEVRGAGHAVDGRYQIATAVHRIEPGSGYIVDFSTDLAPLPAPSSPAIALGRIVDCDDPERRGRVRAALPACEDVETDWLAVVLPGAGPGKGVVAFPAMDDKVLVIFPDGDEARGLVLGGLYGAIDPPDFGADGSTLPRILGLRTGDGQSLLLSGSEARACLSTGGGDMLEMGPDGCRLQARSDLVIEASGKTITIRARAIEFEQG